MDLLNRMGKLIDEKLGAFRRELNLPKGAEGARKTAAPKKAPAKDTGKRGPPVNVLPPIPLRRGGKGRVETEKRSESIGAGKGGAGPKTAPADPRPAPSRAQRLEDPSQLGPSRDRTREEETSWTEVVRKGKGTKGGERTTTTTKPTTPATSAKKPVKGVQTPKNKEAGAALAVKPAGKSKEEKVVRKTMKKRVPSTAAVILTCPPGQYKETMAEVKARISLAELGIPEEGCRMRRTQTGAISLQIGGEDRIAKADAMAGKIRDLLNSREGVKVSRPMKMADVRVSDLDDSAAKEEIATALAEAGGCRPEDVKVGLITKAPNGLGAVWAQCPVAAANKVAAVGKVRVGWARARIVLLETRPLRCFKCLERGHVRAKCPNEVDRSALCYRCGGPGHKAQECGAAPHCLLCSEAGRPAGHRAGSQACTPPPL